MELEKWPIFSLLKQDFKQKLKMFCVFGVLGNESIMVTKENEVYALGFNGSGCLGVGDQTSIIQPQKINSLSEKKIKGLAFGNGPHVLAYTDEGELYSWGNNGFGQLGNGSTNQMSTPYLLGPHINRKCIIKVAAGSHHSLALTEDGEVLAWGQNNVGQIGSGTTTNQPSPKKVIANIGGKRVIDIACCQNSSMAIMDNGEVYTWGFNNSGQLGVGNTVSQYSTCRVTALQGIIITKIVCGEAHTLALSEEGHLYAWGHNSYGQLGTGNKAKHYVPVRIAKNINRIVDIACSHYCHISAAMTENSKIYMWGQCKGQSVLNPMETPLQSLDEVFALWANPYVTHEPIAITTSNPISLAQSLSTLFDDPETSDIVFVVDGRKLHAHRAILKIRCQYFRKMLQDHWKEGQMEEVKINNYSYVVFRAFLQYLYTGSISIFPEDAIGLLDLANAYCEEELKQQCQRTIRHGISIENAAMMYAVAIKYEGTTKRIGRRPKIDTPVGSMFIPHPLPQRKEARRGLKISSTPWELRGRTSALPFRQATKPRSARPGPRRHQAEREGGKAPITPDHRFLEEFDDFAEFCFRFAFNHMSEIVQTEAFMALDEFTVKSFIQKAAQHGAFKY